MSCSKLGCCSPGCMFRIILLQGDRLQAFWSLQQVFLLLLWPAWCCHHPCVSPWTWWNMVGLNPNKYRRLLLQHYKMWENSLGVNNFARLCMLAVLIHEYLAIIVPFWLKITESQCRILLGEESRLFKGQKATLLSWGCSPLWSHWSILETLCLGMNRKTIRSKSCHKLEHYLMQSVKYSLYYFWNVFRIKTRKGNICHRLVLALKASKWIKLQLVVRLLRYQLLLVSGFPEALTPVRCFQSPLRRFQISFLDRASE